MVSPTIIIFKGRPSQTGLAATEEFKEFPVAVAGFEPGEKFDAIAERLSIDAVLAVLPTWNSHEGEITKARVLDLLFEGQARLHRLWPRTIEFECIARAPIGDVKRIISVNVAQTQCSQFLSKLGAGFILANSTPEAYDKFRDHSFLDAALCAPGQNKDSFRTLSKNASNPMNFTTFALLGCCQSKDWGEQQWGVLTAAMTPKAITYFGIEMPIIFVSSSEGQIALINDLTAEAKTVDQIPKVLFVAPRRPDTCGLLVEAEQGITPSDTITEEGFSTDIVVKPDVGDTSRPYVQRVYKFINAEFPEILKADFVRHRGTNTCFFACPPLGLITHGFEEKIVEPVVRRLMTKYFELYINGIACSQEQIAFFEKHKDRFLDQGMNFIEFKDLGLVAG